MSLSSPVSGFGTLGLVHSSEDQADFGVSAFKPDGAGHTLKYSPDVDSRLGVQLTANATPDLSATLQVVVEERENDKYVPRVEWANIKYQLTPQLSVRLGRTAITSFLVADFRKVGYANPWVRPPEEVYGLVPIFSSDGVDVSYKLNVGATSHTVLAGFGKSDTKSSDGSVVKGRHEWTVSDTVEYGPLMLRAAYQTGKVWISTLDAVFAGFRQFGAEGIAIADRYDPNGRKITFLALGGTYDPGLWFVTAEWGRSNLHSAFGKRTVWYTRGLPDRGPDSLPHLCQHQGQQQHFRSRPDAFGAAATAGGACCGTQCRAQRGARHATRAADSVRRRALGLHGQCGVQAAV